MFGSVMSVQLSASASGDPLRVTEALSLEEVAWLGLYCWPWDLFVLVRMELVQQFRCCKLTGLSLVRC
jgi:hypothetical protein